LATVSTSLNKFADSEVELSGVGGVNAPDGTCRELDANSVHTAQRVKTPTRLNSTVASLWRRRCVLGLTVK